MRASVLFYVVNQFFDDVLQFGVTAEIGFDFLYSCHDGGVVPVEFIADTGIGFIQNLPCNIHGYMPRISNVCLLYTSPADKEAEDEN